jgi:homoserine O-acetyltransferase
VPGPPPASGAWRPGDDPGRRRFLTLYDEEPLRLELGGSLSPVEVAYETWGEPDANWSNAVLVAHALTGDSHAAGPPGPGHRHQGWWDGVIGPGKGIDTERYFVVCPNVLGGCQGTTGPASPGPDGRPFGPRFPRITIRDQVAVEAAVADALGIRRWLAVVGGSMGGMRSLEWAVGLPERVAVGIVIGCGAAATAEQIALCSMQMDAIRSDPRFSGGEYYDAPPGEGPHRGMGLARQIGHLSYRSELELETRFGRAAQEGEDPLSGGRYAVESYLHHQADKLARRFDANSYLILSEAMNHHDVGRGRGGVAAALSGIRTQLAVAGIDSDRLYPLRLQRELAALVPNHPEVTVIHSLYGHDSFLIEGEAVGAFLRDTLEKAAQGAPAPADRARTDGQLHRQAARRR